jgi:putative DNA methylase
MLCRYDTMALKSLDVFSVHGFPVGLVQCESNLLGIANGKGIGVGSGGWSNIIDKYAKAKKYCYEPFEVKQVGSRKLTVPIEGEWIGEQLNGHRTRKVEIVCGSMLDERIAPKSLDAVFTDPPYFGNVQYGELMDFCYVWLRKLVGDKSSGFQSVSSKSAAELTGNITEARGLEQFAEGLADIYSHSTRALKPGAPFVFTFHHNKIEAYHAVGAAILDAGLVCTASPPCPAEMSGSIHISGTASSIVDTVFVCREIQVVPPNHTLEEATRRDLEDLHSAGMNPTLGDVRCALMGHATRLAISSLAATWRRPQSVSDKIKTFAGAIESFGDIEALAITLQQETAKQAAERRTKNRARSLFDEATV